MGSAAKLKTAAPSAARRLDLQAAAWGLGLRPFFCHPLSGFWASGLGLWVWGPGFGVWLLGCLGFGAWGLGSSLAGLRARIILTADTKEPECAETLAIQQPKPFAAAEDPQLETLSPNLKIHKHCSRLAPLVTLNKIACLRLSIDALCMRSLHA